jgi:hypothetical protein
MSLTTHLADRTSPVREYIYACAPQLALAGGRGREGKEQAAAFGFNDVLTRGLTVPIPVEVENRRSHAPIAGIAIDYRARMMLGPLDPSETVAARGVDRLAEYTHAVKNGEHRLRVLGEGFDLTAQLVRGQSRADLDRASVLLAWCESVFRGFPEALTGSLGEQLDAASSGGDLLSQIPGLLLADMEALRRASGPQIDAWNCQIAAGDEYAPNPTFEGSRLIGGADADWIIGNTLIECKTVEKLNAPWLRETLFQMLGYTILDFEDRLGIRNVAIWLPRQATLKSWRIDSLIGADAEKAMPALRAGFVSNTSAGIR